jgi:hypothetical protein
MKRTLQCAKRCMRRVKEFAVRAAIIAIALFIVFIVAINAGELIPLSLAIQRITEALGYALADTLADT